LIVHFKPLLLANKKAQAIPSMFTKSSLNSRFENYREDITIYFAVTKWNINH